MYTFTYVYRCIPVYIHAGMVYVKIIYLKTHTYTHTHTHTHPYTNTHPHTHAYMHTNM